MTLNYWVGQNVHSGCYRKTQMNFLAKPIVMQLPQLTHMEPNNCLFKCIYKWKDRYKSHFTLYDRHNYMACNFPSRHLPQFVIIYLFLYIFVQCLSSPRECKFQGRGEFICLVHSFVFTSSHVAWHIVSTQCKNFKQRARDSLSVKGKENNQK